MQPNNATKNVKIYTTSWCPFCHRALAILKDEGIAFEEIAVDTDPDMRVWLQKESGQRTVPQIFFDKESIGGCSELETLVRQGNLHRRVAA